MFQSKAPGVLMMVSESAPPADSARQLPALRPQSPTRTDWRLMLGLSRDDSILVVGKDSLELAQGLRPWVGRIHSSLDSFGIDSDTRDSAHPVLIPEEPAGVPLTAGSLDWIIFEGPIPGDGDVRTTIARLLPTVKPGGRIVLNFDNLGPLGGWRRLRQRRKHPGSSDGVPCRGLGHAVRLFASAGCTEIVCYAVLPNRRAPRTLIPLAPPCPPAAEKFALGQAWKRVARGRALARLALHLLVDLHLLRYLYPHYLVVGRKSC
jgi:hypothetical protein